MLKNILLFFILISVSCSAAPEKEEGYGYVSLSPAVTEIIYFLGGEEKLYGVTSSCDYPPPATGKVSVGEMINPSLEMIKSINPEIVFTAGEPHRELASRLRDMGFEVFEAGSGTVKKVYENISEIGEITGRGEAAEKLISDMQETISELKEQLQEYSPRSVYAEISSYPVMIPAGLSFINEVIEIAGGVNVASDIDKSYIISGMEFIIASDPEIMVILSGAGKGRKDDLRKKLKDRVRASAAGKIYLMENKDTLLRPGPRLCRGIRELAALIHPEALK